MSEPTREELEQRLADLQAKVDNFGDELRTRIQLYLAHTEEGVSFARLTPYDEARAILYEYYLLFDPARARDMENGKL